MIKEQKLCLSIKNKFPEFIWILKKIKLEKAPHSSLAMIFCSQVGLKNFQLF